MFHAGGHDDPEELGANDGKSFQGCTVLGSGFTFDDTANDGVTNTIAEMHRLIEKDPRNADRIFPYVGVEDVNDSPMHAHRRYVINFGDMSEEKARQWPDLMHIVETRVRPQRMTDNRETYRRNWWQFAEKRGELQLATRELRRVLVTPQTSKFRVFAFVANGQIYDKQLYVFSLISNASFSVLQSRINEIWSLFFGSTFEDRPIYTLTGCFRTFVFPDGVLEGMDRKSVSEDNGNLAALETAGREYYEFRAALMVRNNEGLTKTYNRFHDPGDMSVDIVRLRELHDALDRAVLDAYGWTDIRPVCQFLLDFDDDADADDEPPARARTRQRRKPWRYRWPDDLRDEVLARLLKLNADRAEQERRTGAAAAGSQSRGRRARSARTQHRRSE